MDRIPIIDQKGEKREITFAELKSMVELGQSFTVISDETDQKSTTDFPPSPEKKPVEDCGYFTPYQAEKLKKIFLPPHHNETTFSNLIKRLSSHKSGPLADKISTLILAGKFLPHQNILKSKRPIDHMYLVVEDELNSIFDGLKEVVVNFQNLISTSINFSQLRPKMSLIKSTQGFSSGPVSFIKIYTSALDALRQNLPNENTPEQTIILNVQHPDILEYLILVKNFQKTSLNRHIRFQVEITPRFLESLSREQDFELIDPQTRETVNLLSAKNTFDLIVSTILENPQLGLCRSPQIHSQYNVQISGLVNLAAYNHTSWKKDLPGDLQIIERFLSQQSLPPELKIGPNQTAVIINFTGWTDFLIRQGIAYDSLQAIELAGKLFTAAKESIGPQTLVCVSLHSPIQNILPTARGLEPLDQLVTVKTSLEGQEVCQLTPLLKNTLDEEKWEYGTDLARKIFEYGTLEEIPGLPAQVRNIYKTAQEIDPEFHLEFQRKLEEILSGAIEKRIYFTNPLDQEKIKESLLGKLSQGMQNIAFLQLGILPQENLEKDTELGKNFLSTLHKGKKRHHREIQPPLFQIKKTEEITLPPISTI